MLPSLASNVTPTSPITAETGQISIDSAVRSATTSFASLVLARVEHVAGPAISGKAAIMSGKGLPVSPGSLEIPQVIGEADAPAGDPATHDALGAGTIALDADMAVRGPLPFAGNVNGSLGMLAEPSPAHLSARTGTLADAQALLSPASAARTLPLPAGDAPALAPARGIGVDTSSLSAAIQIIEVEGAAAKDRPAPQLPASIAPVRSVPDAEVNLASLPRSSMMPLAGDTEAQRPAARSNMHMSMALTSSEAPEQPASAQQIAAPGLVTASQPAAIVSPAQPAAPAAAPTITTHLADQPHDFSTLIDRLVQARDAAAPANPATVRTVLSHTEFGPVTVRFDHSAANLAVSLASNDPAFAPTARAALAGDTAARGDDHQRHQQHSNGGQPGTDTSGSQTGLQSGAQGGPGSRSARGGGGEGAVHGDAELTIATGKSHTAATAPEARGGLYI